MLSWLEIRYTRLPLSAELSPWQRASFGLVGPSHPHIEHPRIVHVNTDSTGTRLHIHLPLDADAGTPPKPQTLPNPGRKNAKHHPHPLQTAVPASHSILYHRHLLGHRIIPEPLPLPRR